MARRFTHLSPEKKSRRCSQTISLSFFSFVGIRGVGGEKIFFLIPTYRMFAENLAPRFGKSRYN
jgi:hypothetical protein